MIKAAVDTNVLISGLLWKGTSKEIIDKYRFENRFIMIFSPELIHEFKLKLINKFHVELSIVDKWIGLLKENAELVVPNYVTQVCRDEKDNMILDTAVEGHVNFIVSGDNDLLTLNKFKNIPIVKPKEFLNILLH